MSRIDVIQNQLAALQAELYLLQHTPEDVYTFGTLALFSANSNTTKYYVVKVGEELWRNIGGGVEQSLGEFIRDAANSSLGYFEVRILTVPVDPIYIYEPAT